MRCNGEGLEVGEGLGQCGGQLFSHVPLRAPAGLPLTRDVAHLASGQLSSSMVDVEPKRALPVIEREEEFSSLATRWMFDPTG